MNILIVDDKQENQYLLEALLKGNGYDVVQAPNGAAALEKMKSNQIDLIISDILMPVMDGFELCRKIKTNEALKHKPFIVYTATYTGPQDEEFAIKIGADRFIVKPCEPDVLIEIIHDVIAAKQNKIELIQPQPLPEQDVLKLYNERLVRKLEQKMLQLEQEVQTRKIAEEKIKKLNRIYAVLSEINKIIVRTDNQQDLFESACKIAVETGGFTFCWIGITDNNNDHVIPAAQHGFSGGFCDVISISLSPDKPEGQGPTGTALREGRYEICNDIVNDERMKPWREEALKRNYFSSASFPLIRSGYTYGIFILYSSQPGFFDEEEIELLEELSSDISYCIETLEREKQKQKIEEERDRLFNYSIDMMCIEGFDGYFKQLNPAWSKTLGWTNEELMARPCIEFVHPEDRISTMEMLEDLKTGADVKINFLKRFLCKDETHKWLSWNSVIIKKEKLIFCVLRDVTAQIKNEVERKNLEAQLIQAQKLESLGTMAGGIAHDFNNILNIIMGYASILKMPDCKEDERIKNSNVILDAGKRGAELVKQLLTFARKSETVFQTVQVNDSINEITNLLKETFPKTVEIKCELQEDLPVAIADSTQIHQVLLNLCVNARDAMSKGGILTIATKTMPGDIRKLKNHSTGTGGYIEIQVSDTGTGMDEKIKQKIFEPFFTTKDSGKGTGLGLALVYGIVKNHGGFIDLISEPGQGTSFFIYLPAQEQSDEIQEIFTKTDDNSLQGTGTILLIEDETVSSELLTTILVLKGYKVLTAYDGLQGINVYQKYKEEITVVITDLGLPHLEGEDVFKQIKTINPEAKIILISGFIDPEVKARLHETGAQYIVQKPFIPDKILQTIKEIAENKQYTMNKDYY